MAANGFDDDRTRSFTNLTAGTQISHYKIISRIGAGGMGEVYLAQDTQLDRQVALKFLPQNLSQDEASRARFTREARAAAKLDHPNIVPVYEVGEFQGRPFFTMAHIEGKSLREVIKEGRLSISEAISITMQICEGLHKAHESGVVHRDIKPSNIIIDGENRTRLLDFGLATVSGEKKLTKTGSTLGTIGYMSPELVKGEKADHRSDLFSVGVVLYEMITGRMPFEADHEAAIQYNIINEQPEPLSRYKSGVTGELQQIIDKALSKDSSLRYQHADGMLADLKRLSVGPTPATRSKIRLWLALAIAVVAIPGYFLIDQFLFHKKTAIQGWSNSIAVLPFRDFSPNQDQEYFCDGMTDAIIGRLSNIKDLKVISMTSVMRFKGAEQDLKNIGKELGVETILEGSIIRDRDNIRVTAQLINVKDDAHLWSDQYDREIKDIFAVQDDISQSLADVMRITLIEGEKQRLSNRGTTNIEAYNNYAQGRYFWRKRTADGIKQAIEYFEKAIEIDPDYALTWSGLSDAWIVLPGYSGEPYPEYIKTAKEAALTAVSLDSNLAEAHASLGLVYQSEGDVANAVKEHETALMLNPNYVWTHIWYGNIMDNRMGRKDVKIEHLYTAIDLDPLNVVALNNLAAVLSDSGLYNEAVVHYKKIVEIVPENVTYRTFLAYAYQKANQIDEFTETFEKAIEINPERWGTYLAYANRLIEIKREKDAINLFEKVISDYPDSARAYAYYGYLLYDKLKNYSLAIEKYNKAKEIDPEDHEVYNELSYAYTKIGDFDKALESVNKAIRLLPNSIEYIDSRADLYYSFGYFDEAIEDHRTFLKERPNWLVNVRKMAEAATFNRDYELADSCYEVIASHAGITDQGWGQYFQSRILRHRGKFRETVEMINDNIDFIRKELGHCNQLSSLFWIQVQMYDFWLEDYGKALSCLDSVLEISKALSGESAKNARLAVNDYRGLIYIKMGELKKAEEAIRRIDTTVDVYEYLWLGITELTRENYAQAVKYLEVLPDSSYNTNNALWKGLAYLENQQIEQAIKNLEYAAFRFDNQSAQLPSFVVWVGYQLGRAYEADGQIERAIQQYQTFLDIWKNADEGLKSVEDAKTRLAKLKKSI